MISFSVLKVLSLRLALFLLCLSLSACAIAPQTVYAKPYKSKITKTLKYYTVKKGDTLYSIGVRSGKGYKRLSWWNNIKKPYRLEIGQKIKLFKSKQKLRVIKKTKKTKYKPTKKRNVSQKTSMISNNNKKMLKLYWQWPMKGKIIKTFFQTDKKGIDISGVTGQKVTAAAKGKVVYSGFGLKGYGNLLIIQHNTHYLSAYANNRQLLVKKGQRVKKGQVIAKMGILNGKRIALHFEIRKNGKPVNPLNYLPKK